MTPRSPASPCITPGCWRLQPCPVHCRKPFARPHPYAGGRAWQRTRKRIVERDGHRCRYCGAPAEVVDHVLCCAHGGTDDDSNLVASCKRCNEMKRRQEARAGRGTRSTDTMAVDRRSATPSAPKRGEPVSF